VCLCCSTPWCQGRSHAGGTLVTAISLLFFPAAHSLSRERVRLSTSLLPRTLHPLPLPWARASDVVINVPEEFMSIDIVNAWSGEPACTVRASSRPRVSLDMTLDDSVNDTTTSVPVQCMTASLQSLVQRGFGGGEGIEMNL